ncbi:MAG: WYL domain-containing protein [Xanthomonadales bacterium]|nr:WYL domain-containing protein [Xanthomonadales bacterium]
MRPRAKQPGLLEGELESLQRRINALLQQKGVDAGDAASRVHIQPVAGRPVPGHLFQDVLGALAQRQRLEITYHGRRRDEVSRRTISPQRLTQYRNSWYLDAWCHNAQGLRSFALERIRDLKRTAQSAREVPAGKMSAHFDASYGIFSGPAEHTAELKFSPEMSRWISEERWHPDQQGQFDPDGSWRLRIPFSHSRELIMDILRYGADVEVVGPESLRDTVRTIIGEMSRHYTSG